MTKAQALKRIKAAAAQADREIELLSTGDKYARGLGSEGYAGGYRQALSDVLLLLQSGSLPNTRDYWSH